MMLTKRAGGWLGNLDFGTMILCECCVSLYHCKPKCLKKK